MFQHAPGRRLGVGQHRRLSGEVLRPRLSDRAQLYHLRHDALRSGAHPPQNVNRKEFLAKSSSPNRPLTPLLGGRDLDGYLSASPADLTSIHLAHAAGAAGRKDFVGAEFVAGRKRHVLESYIVADRESPRSRITRHSETAAHGGTCP